MSDTLVGLHSPCRRSQAHPRRLSDTSPARRWRLCSAATSHRDATERESTMPAQLRGCHVGLHVASWAIFWSCWRPKTGFGLTTVFDRLQTPKPNPIDTLLRAVRGSSGGSKHFEGGRGQKIMHQL